MYGTFACKCRVVLAFVCLVGDGSRTNELKTSTRAHHVFSEGRSIDVGVELARHAAVREEAHDVHHVPSGLGRRSDVPVCRASLRYHGAKETAAPVNIMRPRAEGAHQSSGHPATRCPAEQHGACMCSPPRVESPPKRDRAERLYVPFWDRPVRKNGAHMIEAKHGHDMTAQLRYQRRAALSCRDRTHCGV